MSWPVEIIRQQFPALGRQINGRPAVFLDGPAGSQVPRSVSNAVTDYLLNTNANRGAPFATAVESDAVLDHAHEVLADFFGAPDPQEVCFGANMTTITFQVSRALSRRWQPGDEIVVCRGDHDGNYSPWVLAAEDAGVTIRHIELNPDDWSIDLNSLDAVLSDKTRLVAAGLAGNATGNINPVAEIARRAHAAGALVYVDAVHFAPHGRIDVQTLDCDFLVCSAYKFFGPHVGILWGRRHLLEEFRPYKLRPAPNTLPGRWMTGTQCHEGIAGAAAAVEYLASLGQPQENAEESTRSTQLDSAFRQIVTYEQSLSEQLLHGLTGIPGVRVHGIQDFNQLEERVPTMSLTCPDTTPEHLAGRLADEGIFTWAGNHYAQPFTEAAGLEPNGTLRIGALHYTTSDEIDRVVDAVRRHAP